VGRDQPLRRDAFRIDNSGTRLACLFGLDQTRAPFVLFLDADDELKPGALGKIIDCLDPGVAKLQFLSRGSTPTAM
jgi:glycosyltransferase involved in cell wall biosynthesis